MCNVLCIFMHGFISSGNLLSVLGNFQQAGRGMVEKRPCGKGRKGGALGRNEGRKKVLRDTKEERIGSFGIRAYRHRHKLFGLCFSGEIA